MRTPVTRAAARRSLAYAAGLGAIWVVVAALRPATTYHLAPVLVAATLPFVLVSEEPAPHVRATVGAAGAGAALALGLTGLLAAADWLRGPSLLPFGGAVAESVIFSVAGGIGGLVVGLLRRRT